MLHPKLAKKESFVSKCLNLTEGPIVAATDYMKIYPDQIREFISKPYITLGTDGYGRSDTREKLRSFFEVDSYHITIAALKALCDGGSVKSDLVNEAIKKYGVNPDRQNPARS
tara:strand:- start:599 stop:937 length:339 start_codon:yes stop_codon:yes gene_type:complete